MFTPEQQVFVQQIAGAEARRRDLLNRVCDKPFNVRHADLDLDCELKSIEDWLLSHPPLCDANGINASVRARPFGRGLVETRRFDDILIPQYPRDSFPVIPVNQWDDFLTGTDAVDLAPFVPFMLSQGSVGSCACEALAQAIQICRAVDRQEAELLNPWFAYHTVSGGRDVGSSLQDNVAFMTRYGLASAAVWPRSHGWRTKPNAAAYEDAKKYRILEIFRISTWEEFGSALLYGMPVYFGYSGHAICAVTVISASRIKYANSWSDSWGDGGFGTLSRDSIYWGYGVYGAISEPQLGTSI